MKVEAIVSLVVITVLLICIYYFTPEPPKDSEEALDHKIWMDFKNRIRVCNDINALELLQDNVDLKFGGEFKYIDHHRQLCLEITLRRKQLKRKSFS